MLSSEWIREEALGVGFGACGIARCYPLVEQREFFARWLGEGLHDGLAYLERNIETRFDPARLVSGARTVIVCLVSYNHEAWRSTCAAEIAGRETNDTYEFPKIASYALAQDYHITIREMLERLLGIIRERYPNCSGRSFTDTAPLSEKAWAAEAGLGWIGKHSLLISPQYGSFVLLGEVVIDIEADHYDEPAVHDGCGECRRCLDACPNGAITAPRTLDLRRCISHLSIERPAATFSEHRAVPAEPDALHGWIFGCDICQAVCPHNNCAPRYTNPAFAPRFNPAAISREQWLAMPPDAFEKRFGKTPVARRGLASIRTQLAKR